MEDDSTPVVQLPVLARFYRHPRWIPMKDKSDCKIEKSFKNRRDNAFFYILYQPQLPDMNDLMIIRNSDGKNLCGGGKSGNETKGRGLLILFEDEKGNMVYFLDSRDKLKQLVIKSPPNDDKNDSRKSKGRTRLCSYDFDEHVEIYPKDDPHNPLILGQFFNPRPGREKYKFQNTVTLEQISKRLMDKSEKRLSSVTPHYLDPFKSKNPLDFFLLPKKHVVRIEDSKGGNAREVYQDGLDSIIEELKQYKISNVQCLEDEGVKTEDDLGPKLMREEIEESVHCDEISEDDDEAFVRKASAANEAVLEKAPLEKRTFDMLNVPLVAHLENTESGEIPDCPNQITAQPAKRRDLVIVKDILPPKRQKTNNEPKEGVKKARPTNVKQPKTMAKRVQEIVGYADHSKALEIVEEKQVSEVEEKAAKKVIIQQHITAIRESFMSDNPVAGKAYESKMKELEIRLEDNEKKTQEIARWMEEKKVSQGNVEHCIKVLHEIAKMNNSVNVMKGRLNEMGSKLVSGKVDYGNNIKEAEKLRAELLKAGEDVAERYGDLVDGLEGVQEKLRSIIEKNFGKGKAEQCLIYLSDIENNERKCSIIKSRLREDVTGDLGQKEVNPFLKKLKDMDKLKREKVQIKNEKAVTVPPKLPPFQDIQQQMDISFDPYGNDMSFDLQAHIKEYLKLMQADPFLQDEVGIWERGAINKKLSEGGAISKKLSDEDAFDTPLKDLKDFDDDTKRKIEELRTRKKIQPFNTWLTVYWADKEGQRRKTLIFNTYATRCMALVSSSIGVVEGHGYMSYEKFMSEKKKHSNRRPTLKKIGSSNTLNKPPTEQQTEKQEEKNIDRYFTVRYASPTSREFGDIVDVHEDAVSVPDLFALDAYCRFVRIERPKRIYKYLGDKQPQTGNEKKNTLNMERIRSYVDDNVHLIDMKGEYTIAQRSFESGELTIKPQPLNCDDPKIWTIVRESIARDLNVREEKIQLTGRVFAMIRVFLQRFISRRLEDKSKKREVDVEMDEDVDELADLEFSDDD